jgi:general secretion pathway protein I
VRFTTQSEKGLTLIEVLIALAILSIALTAIIKSTSENIRGTLYLQNKMIAAWVGADAMNSIRAGVIKVPGHMQQEINMLNHNWEWEAKLVDTPNKRIKEIDVDVTLKPEGNKLSHMVSFLYVAS